jgi:hypothetical protein
LKVRSGQCSLLLSIVLLFRLAGERRGEPATDPPRVNGTVAPLVGSLPASSLAEDHLL